VSDNGKRKGSNHSHATVGDNGPGHESVGHAACQQHAMLVASRVCGWFRVDGSDGLRLFARKEANSPSCGEADTNTHEHPPTHMNTHEHEKEVIMSTNAVLSPIAVTFPVEPEGIGPVAVAAWIFPPTRQAEQRGDPPSWLLCLPGGTYRGLAYFDRQVPGCSPAAFSMARVLAAQGIGSVVIDNLGTGDSPVPDHVSGWHLTRQVYADAYRQLTEQLRERLTTGALCDGLAPVAQPFVVGVGHSMGGMLALQLQASSGVCDALCLLGWATRTLVPLDELFASVGMSADLLATLITPNGYVPPAALRASVRSWFFAPSVPTDLIEADEQDATVMPAGMLESVTPGALSGEAAQVRCPLFLGFAAGQEVTSSPHEEVAAYPAVRSLTLFVQSQANHCANFAPTRFELWDEIAAWVSWVSHKALLAQDSDQRPPEEDEWATQPLSL